jgi:micrococcal nuclease
MKNLLYTLLILFVSIPVIAASEKQEKTVATLLRIVDGDTLRVRIGRFEERVRMIGIDTPEKEANEKAFRDKARTHQDISTITSQGKSSWEHLQSMIKPGQQLLLEYDAGKYDRHKRILAYVYTNDGAMLNEKMLLDGYASPYTIAPNVKYAKKFQDAYSEARLNHRGLWAKK